MKITLVKKILADGSPCKKCLEVLQKIESSDQMQYIDEVIIADEANQHSEGMRLAAKHNVTKAPFFIVEHDDGSHSVYTVYFKLVKDVIKPLQKR